MSRRFKRVRRVGVVAALAAIWVGATACGVILYPECTGPVNGRIDPVIAVLGGM